jgi:5-methylcytosine-specific restriction enzyme A
MKLSNELSVGNKYSRKQLGEIVGATGGNLNTGVFQPKGYESVLLFVTERKPKGQTQYTDLLKGDVLEWQGQTSGRTDARIRTHKEDGVEILVFYRNNKSEFNDYAFAYEGSFEYVKDEGSRPTNFTLRRIRSLHDIVLADLDAYSVEEGQASLEGKAIQAFGIRYERDSKLRTAAIEFHGTTCKACGFNFANTYGDRGIDFIEVHHLEPLSLKKEQKLVDPKKDMTVVCSNCHRMIHRNKDNILDIEQLNKLVEDHKRGALQKTRPNSAGK